MQRSHPTIRDIADALEAWACPAWAESYDNVGLQVGDPACRVTRAVVALDCTPAVVSDAVRRGVGLVITHHPLLFHPVRSVTWDAPTSNLILRLARAHIALYSVHTNLDAAPGGVSVTLAEKLDLADVELLATRDDAPQAGMGAIGRLSEPQTLKEYLQLVAARLRAPSLRYVGDLAAVVETIAVCGGAGTFLTQRAIEAGADAFVTSDVSYHRFFEVLRTDGSPRMALVDAGHYETEVHVEMLLVRWLSERFPTVEWLRTTAYTSPVSTFMSAEGR